MEMYIYEQVCAMLPIGHAVLKIGQFAMPKTSENWVGLVNSCVNHAQQIRQIYQVLPYSVDFKDPQEHWNPLSKKVLSKYSFIWNIGFVTIWNGRKVHK